MCVWGRGALLGYLMSLYLAPLQLKRCTALKGFWNFCRPNFILVWFMYIWIIWPRNEFGKKAQCEYHVCIGVTHSFSKCRHFMTEETNISRDWSGPAAAANFTPHLQMIFEWFNASVLYISPEIRANIANIAYNWLWASSYISFQYLITSHETYDDYCLFWKKIPSKVKQKWH